MDTAIEIRGLTKHYGSVVGVEDLDLDVPVGEVFGFLGPNGAGKSTTIRLLLDLIRPTRGEARVLGLDTLRDSLAIRSRTGYLPGELRMYDRMTGRELLEHFAALRGMGGLGDAGKIAARLDLDLTRRIRSYSSGNRQKLGLVQAFMHRPELLILDEPTGGLDPLVQQEFYAMLGEVTAEGRTVFLSSHILPEVERIADRVAIIREGHLVVSQTVAELKAQTVRRIELRFAAPVAPNEFASLSAVRSVETRDGDTTVDLVVAGPVDAVIKAAARHEVVGLATRQGDLEDAFLALYEEGTHAP